MVIADVEVLHGHRERLHNLGIAVAEVVGASVEVQVDQALARHIPEVVLLATVDDEGHPGVDPELRLAGIPVLPGLVEHLGFGGEGEDPVVVLGGGGRVGHGNNIPNIHTKSRPKERPISWIFGGPKHRKSLSSGRGIGILPSV